ncbi:MAG: PAS domain S-box protein [Candidatus Competibacteraceae bacterium]|nr:PAS domain S-box protein [Candidatus Competibacteraceae bacterium]
MQADQHNLSRRVLNRLLLLIAVTALLVSGLVIQYNWRMEHEALYRQASEWVNELRFDLRNAMTRTAHGLQQTLQVISAQSALKQALAQEDVARLQADWMEIFKQLRAEYNVTHFYFISRNRTCLLRLHLLQLRGDHIDRHTALEAERTGKTAWGVEIGKTGILTLRVVQPVFAGDRLVGYVELGKEIVPLLATLWPPDEYASMYAVLLHKKHIDRASWETGMRMMGRKAEWGALPDYVVEFMSPKLTVPALRSILPRLNMDHGYTYTEVGGRVWYTQINSLRVISGEKVSTLLILHDVTDRQHAIMYSAIMLMLMTLFVVGFVVLFFAWVMTRFFHEIEEQEERLRDSEARFRMLFESSPDPIWIMEDHHFTECNQATVEILGFPSKAAFKNAHPIEISPEFQPDGENSFSKAERMMNLAQKKGLHRFDWIHRRRDGSEFYAEVTLSMLTLQGQRVLYALVRDITAQHAAAQALQQFKDTLDQVHDCVFMCDVETLRFIYVNQGAIEQVGYDQQTLLTLHPYDIEPGYSERLYRALIAPLLNEEIPFLSFETRHRHRDGHDIPVEVFLQHVRTEEQASRLVTIVRDISERKRVEDELRHSEEKLRTILDSVEACIYLKDTNGNYLFANATMRRLWQAEMEDIVGYGDEKFFDAETAANIRRGDHQILVDGAIFRTEESLTVTATGRTLTVLSVKLPLRREDGRIYALCGISTDISDRKQMEERLRKSEQDLKEAQHLAKMGSWELNISSNQLIWSDEIFRLFELDPAHFDASYDAFLNAIHPEDHEAVNKAYTDSLQTRQPYSIRHRLRMADGRIKHVHEQCQTDFDEAGNPLRSVGTIQDVTELVQTEVALHDARNLLQTVIDHVPMRVFWKDRALNYLGCNPAFVRDNGWSQPSELIGKDDYQIGWANEADWYRADDLKVIESGIPRINCEALQTTPNGRSLWLRTSKVPLRNQNDEIIGVLGIYEDITEEKEKDRELARYRDHLEQLVAERSAQLDEAQVKHQQLLDDMGDEFMAFSFTPENLVTYVSNSVESIFGLPKESAMGQLWIELIQWLPEDLEETRLYLQDMLSGKVDSSQTEMRFVHPDGQIRTIYQTSHLVRNAFGDVVSVEGVLTNITQRKRSEMELLQAKRAAEAASQAKSAFLANMSHEIRTPMNGVIGMLEILSHSPLSDEERKMVRMIHRSARSLLGIIDDILDFSKIEAGKLSLVEQEMSLETELDIVISLIDRIAMDKQVELTLFFEPKLPQRVIGDGLRVRQILTNLAGNAVKFSIDIERVGRVQLRAELGQYGNGLVWVVFTVVDNGIGIDAETVARLFQPFEQADSSTTRKYGGTGLGLSISQTLTAMMGGEISVQSETGQGTTFTVRLPFKLASECPNTASPYDLSGLECIVVANETQYIEDYMRYLTHAGAQTQAFADIEAAWTFIGSYAPETSICMVVMEDPGIHSAQEVVEHLLAKQPGENVHFVEITYLRVERGKRRKVRRLADKIVQIDREALTRCRFLEAVAAATGRVAISQGIDMDESFDANVETGLNILVAEDNEVNRDVIRRQLEMLGHRATLAVDGVKAFQQWKAGRYDLLLTDLHMPNKDGYELTALIRDAERRLNLNRIPIIALTANVIKGEEERCLKQDMDAYLSKPIELARLKLVLDQWLSSVNPSVAHVTEEATSPTHVIEILELPVFDAEVLTKMVGNNAAIHQRLLEKFLVNAQQQMSELLQASKAQNTEMVGQIAHTLKSAARSVGAMRLGELCQQLEYAGKAGDGECCQALSKRLNATFDEVARVLRSRLADQ